MDYLVNYILQGQTSFTPDVLVRVFFLVLVIREIFGILHDLIDFSRRF